VCPIGAITRFWHRSVLFTRAEEATFISVTVDELVWTIDVGGAAVASTDRTGHSSVTRDTTPAASVQIAP
jgi:hypothetical protein